MQLLITTQYQENYGAHDWDGTGACPQYWKFKGGQDYKYDLGPAGRSQEALTELVMALRPQIEEDNDYVRNHIIDWRVVGDDYLTEFERDQLDWEGRITFPARKLSLETA
jgi:hypothetical protein